MMNAPFAPVSTSAEQSADPKDVSKLTMTDLALLVHDLRAPILSILGFNSIAKGDDHSEGNDQARARIDMLGDHLLALVNNILLAARSEHEQIVLDRVVVNAPRLLADVLSVVKPTADAKQIRLGLKMAQDLPLEFMGDPVRLRQILINLASNAVTYSPAGSLVEIEAGLRLPLPVLYFSVRDQGPGMTEQETKAVFRPFHQIQRISGSQGTGLGLTICDRLIQAMNGSVEVQSSLGMGSTFTVMLPFAGRDPDHDQDGTAPEPASEKAIRTFDILVVDDNELSNEIVSHVAAKAGHKVSSVLSGSAALAFLAQNAVDLVILDQRMSGLDGLETARRIRGMDFAQRAPKIVGLTAHLTPEMIDNARTAGMDDCFQKTMRPKDLITMIEAILARP